MSVPLLDLKAQYATIKEQIIPVVMDVIETQGFILGPKVTKLEEETAAFIGCPHALGVSSGTDALLLALMGLDIGPGDEVITTPYTFFATGGCIARVGAKPVFVDIEPDTYNIDVAGIERAITAKTRAIMPVHLFGQCVDMDPVLAIARKHGLKVIEDAAQAIGATYKGKQAGTMGDVGCFSFFPSKNLGGFGDGGLITTNDAQLYGKLKALRVHGGEQQYLHPRIGINGRLDSLQAAVLSVKLPHLPAWTEGRRRNADRYDAILAANKAIRTPVRRNERYHIFNQYVINTDRRDELKAHLTEKGIGCAVYYPLPLHLQGCFDSLGYKRGDMPIAEEAAHRTLALPVYPELPPESLELVGRTILEFFS